MLINTRNRSNEAEIMDDFEMEGYELEKNLDEIAKINSILGGNGVTLRGILHLIKNKARGTPITILDLGCGNGDMLRTLSDFGQQNQWKFNLIGVDANPYTIYYAQYLSKMYPEIHYECLNIFSKDFSDLNYDIALCTLTLHHFNDEEIIDLMSTLTKKSKIGIVINDLHRSALAYYLFQLVCFVFGLSKMSTLDGSTSILKGFKKQELINFSKKLTFKNYQIRWKWAFRYQWIIRTI